MYIYIFGYISSGLVIRRYQPQKKKHLDNNQQKKKAIVNSSHQKRTKNHTEIKIISEKMDRSSSERDREKKT